MPRIVKSIQKMDNYSEEAIAQFIEKAVGFVVTLSNGTPVGTVVKATRIEGTNHVELETEVNF